MRAWQGMVLAAALVMAGCARPSEPLPSTSSATTAPTSSVPHPSAPPATTTSAAPSATSPAPTVPATSKPAPPPPAWRETRIAEWAFEPSVAWLPDGSLWATVGSSRSPRLWVSHDGGQAWGAAPPPAWDPPDPDWTLGDSFVQQAPDGSLWFSALAGKPGDRHGILVAHLEPAGWTSALVQLPQPLQEPTSLDRQWLGFLAGRVVLVCNCPLGVAFTSDDGGRTWSAGTALPSPGRQGPYGMPVTLGDGRLLTAYVAGPVHGMRDVWGLMTRDGVAWTAAPIAIADVAICCGMVGAAVAGATTFVTWHGAEGPRIATSVDGVSWTAPVTVAQAQPAYPQPWVAAMPGDVAVAWFEDTGLHLARGSPAALDALEVTRFPLAEPETDFPSLAYGPDERLALAWTGDAGTWVSAES